MKVSVRWLFDFVKFDLSPEELANKLTMAGLEVEGCARVGQEFSGIVAGKVVSLSPHPRADQLVLCQVDVGSEVVPIVCGASNIRSGHHVPVALPGSVLPDGTRIERSEIRGEASVGMMCSELELGLGEDASGIMILPQNGLPGEPISSLLGLEDHILDVSVTPNRGDCLSILGVAREISAILGCPLLPQEPRVREGSLPIADLTSVQIVDEDLCGRYAARIIEGIQIAPSPLWMRWRLKTAGIRPISNVVDVTNYVMLERGQPLHAFDFDRLHGKRIIVRRARDAEALVTLDGVSRVLSSQMLVIADAQEAVAIAGVMGGSTSEVGTETRNVLLESAWFDPVSIRRTSKALGLQSEASYRFERRVDPEGAVLAADRAAQLILEIAGGEAAAGVFDAYPRRYAAPVIALRPYRANRILGTNLRKAQMVSIMGRLGFSTLSREGRQLKVAVPSFRGDISREIDLVEEIARIHGFERIPSHFPRGEIRPWEESPSLWVEGTIRRLLSASGFFEVINFSFTRPEVFDKLRLLADDPLRRAVRLRNPLSEEACLLRSHLLPSLLENLRRNESRNLRTIKIFEIAKTFHPLDTGALPKERREVAAVAVGPRFDPHWDGQAGEVDFFFLKGMVDFLGRMLGLPMEWGSIQSPFLHPGRAASIVASGRELGWIGQIHPEVAESFDLAASPFGFGWVDLDLVSSLSHPQRGYSSLPRFPAVVRDVALLVPADLPYSRPNEVIRRAGGDLVDEVRLFDVYQGESIPAGYKSLGFSIHYRAKDRTLTDEEVNRIHGALLQILQKDLGAEIR
ncbi:MAG: phenylalanine--tRNA ligase subunit beta [candidate division NC10 bacterium]|nr:phenylalanine--tRNA ligase subunit beta [candidate division NC10 bacterium]